MEVALNRQEKKKFDNLLDQLVPIELYSFLLGIFSGKFLFD